MRLIGRVAIGLALSGAALLVAATPADAHAVLLGSTPVAGSTVPEPPAEVALTFSERVTAIALDVMDADGQPVAAGPIDSGDGGRVISVPLQPSLPDGVYVVRWQVVSADSHPLEGAFDFGVGTAMATGTLTVGGGENRWVDLGFGAARWLGFAGAALLVGTTIFLFTIWPAGRASAARRLPWVGLGLALVASVAQLLLQAPYTGQRVEEALTSPFGGVIFLRLAVLAAAAALLIVLATRHTTTADQVVLGGPVAVALLATWPLNGHARAADAPVLAVAMDTLHLLAISTWLGGLVVLTFFVLREAGRERVEPIVSRFSSLALGCVAVIIATGTYQAWREVGTWPALPGTAYGRLLLIKIGLFAGIIWLGWLARRWIQRVRAGGPAQLRLSVGAEVIIAAVILALTAALVATEPARDTYSDPVHTTLAIDAAHSLRVDLEPARVGMNTVRLSVRGTDGAPRDVPEVTAEVSIPERDLGPFDLALDRTEPGTYATNAASLPYSGRWTLEVTVRTSEFDQTTVSTPVTVR